MREGSRVGLGVIDVGGKLIVGGAVVGALVGLEGIEVGEDEGNASTSNSHTVSNRKIYTHILKDTYAVSIYQS